MTARVAIIGGGPVGLATSVALAMRGAEVVVFEQQALEGVGAVGLDKACGEGLMPAGRRALESLGVRVDGAASEFRGLRFCSDARVVTAEFEASGPMGLAIRRTDLWRALYDRACAVGVDVRLGTAASWHAVRGESPRITALGESIGGLHFVVVATGLRGTTTLDRSTRMRDRLGLRQHYHATSPPFVEVWLGDGQEAYVTPLGARGVGVALLGSRRPEHRPRAAAGRLDLTAFPELAARFETAPILSRVRGAGPFRRRRQVRLSPHVAAIGDAAGYIDPVTGEGLSLGLQSALDLATSIVEYRNLEYFESMHRQRFAKYRLTVELLLFVSQQRPIRRLSIGWLARHPNTLNRLLSWVV